MISKCTPPDRCILSLALVGSMCSDSLFSSLSLGPAAGDEEGSVGPSFAAAVLETTSRCLLV